MLKTKIKTVVVLNLIIIPLVIFGDTPYLMNIAAALVAVISIYEIYRAAAFAESGGKLEISGVTEGKGGKTYIPGSISEKILFLINEGGAIAMCFVPLPNYEFAFPILFTLVAVVFMFVMLSCSKLHRVTVVPKFLLCGIIPVFFRTLPEIRSFKFGMYYMFSMVIVSILNEMGGFFIGRKIGKHKFAPLVSPNKSVEGSIGGVVVALVLLNIIVPVTAHFAHFGVDWFHLEVFIIAGSAVAQFGDLAMSSIKRICGVKDFGTLLPGHGGILDRFDAQLFLAPAAYMIISYKEFFLTV